MQKFLYDIASECANKNIEVAICGLQSQLRGILDSIGVTELIGKQIILFQCRPYAVGKQIEE